MSEFDAQFFDAILISAAIASVITTFYLGYLFAFWNATRKAMRHVPKRKPLADRRFVPKKGMVWNPLKKFPPNNNCWCGSLKKSKNCCAQHVADACSAESAKVIKSEWEGLLNGTVILPAPGEEAEAG